MGWGCSLVTAVAVWTTVACGAGADEPDVSRVESTGESPRPGELGAMDAGLVGLRTGRNDEYVTYDCADLSTPLFGVVYAGDAEAREVEPIEATEREGVSFGDPIVAGDRLIIPEFGDDGLVAVTTVE
jgi:hypothetical protein